MFHASDNEVSGWDRLRIRLVVGDPGKPGQYCAIVTIEHPDPSTTDALAGIGACVPMIATVLKPVESLSRSLGLKFRRVQTLGRARRVLYLHLG